MKKILAIGLGLVTAFGASAQNWTPQSFLADNVVAVNVSNYVSSIAGGVTNVLSTTGQGGLGPGTNIAHTKWVQRLSDNGSNSFQSTVVTIFPPWGTNAAYTNLVTAALDNSTGTNLLATKNLFSPYVSLWTDREGRASLIPPLTTGNSNSYGTIFVRTVGMSVSATNFITCVLEGIPYVDKDGNAYGTTLPAERFVFNAGCSNGVIVTVTNFPAYKYIGFRGMRLGSLSLAANADNVAAGDAYVTDFRFVGFVP